MDILYILYFLFQKEVTMYRLVKKEYTTPRPDWVVALLLHLQPETYRPQRSHHHLRAILRYVRLLCNTCSLREQQSKLSIVYSPDTLSIVNKHRRPILKFKIVKIKDTDK